MDYPGIHVGRHHDGGRLQEENPTPAATSATTAAGPDSLNLGESQYDSKGPVDDAQHVTVKMSNGIETTLEARGPVSFSKVKSDDTIKLSVIAGKVPVFQIQ